MNFRQGEGRGLTTSHPTPTAAKQTPKRPNQITVKLIFFYSVPFLKKRRVAHIAGTFVEYQTHSISMR